MSRIAFAAPGSDPSGAGAGSPIFAVVAVLLILGAMALAFWVLKSERFAQDTFFRRRAKFMLGLGPVLIAVFVGMTLLS